MSRVLRSLGVGLVLGIGPAALEAQAGGTFAPGGQQLVLLDFSTFPLGSIPPSRLGECRPGTPTICDIRGELAVVMHDGQPMLRASGRSSFVVRLPQRLPSDFTLEFDLIPKTCCQPEDLSFEGVADIAYGQTAVSANVLWHHNSHAIVGGVTDGGFSKPMPEKLTAAVMGSLANIAVSFRGTSLTMYTNGEEVYSVQREFVRGSVLRVFLGGQNDTDRAVYLARLRIATGAPVVVAAPGPTTAGGTITPMVPAAQTPSVPGRTGEVVSGSGVRNPAAAADASLFAPPAPRTITIAGIAASGMRLAPRIISLPVFTASGTSSSLPARTIRLNAVTGTGTHAVPMPRTIALTGTTASGTRRAGRGSSAPAQRTINLPPYAASGSGSRVASRTVTLAAFAAAGVSSKLAARTIRLAAVDATGGARLLSPRTITLAGWTFSGTAKIP